MNYGPGHNGFAFQADTYCVQCGEFIVKSLRLLNIVDSGDSGQFPQPIFFGESDSQVFCVDCDDFMYGEKYDSESYLRPGDRNDSCIETNPLYRRQMRDAGRGNQLP